MPRGPDAIQTTIDLPADLRNEAEAYAKAHYMSLSAAIRYLLRKGLDSEKVKP